MPPSARWWAQQPLPSDMNIHAIEQATHQVVAQGIRVLNGHMLAESEREHVRVLLDSMNPLRGAHIIDAGCGVGGVADLMRELRPDLQFTLVNLSQAQLDLCPPDLPNVLASFDDMPVESGSADIVMFNYSLCHSADWVQTLREAGRVLREGGTLFVYDMARLAGDNDLMVKHLSAVAYPPSALQDVARRCGFVMEHHATHAAAANRLRDFMPAGHYDVVVGDVVPATWRFRKESLADPIASAFARHQRIGFQFSGGRDSTAALYLLREHWDRMAIFHLNTNDQFPETRAVVDRVEADLGRPLIRIMSDVHATRRDYGLASDLVPVDNTDVGRLLSGRPVRIISRFECCARTLMNPMHERILADGISLLIRGQRTDEFTTVPFRSGQIDRGLEFLYPIEDWTGEQVSEYLKSNGLPIAPFYENGARRAPECMGCTAWWDEGRADYLRKFHPQAYEAHVSTMKLIKAEIHRQYAFLE